LFGFGGFKSVLRGKEGLALQKSRGNPAGRCEQDTNWSEALLDWEMSDSGSQLLDLFGAKDGHLESQMVTHRSREIDIEF
jgi:hypothetical protein